jgi:ELWxxDGT repeat protein
MRPFRLLARATSARARTLVPVIARALAVAAAFAPLARAQGTLVYDFEPGGGTFGNGYLYGEGAPLRDRLVLGAQVAGDHELWISDGTSAGTQLVLDIHPTLSSFPRLLTAFGDYVVFVARGPDGYAVWRTDGTAAGTIALSPASLDQDFTHFTQVGGELYYHRTGPGGSQLWKTDGSVAGTSFLCAIPAPYTHPPRFLELNGALMFTHWVTGAGGRFELWTTDGSAEATARFAILPFEGANPTEFTAFDARVFFSSFDLSNGRELWVTDGTTAGTAIFANLAPGSGDFNPQHLCALDNGKLVFRDHLGLFGPPSRLWSTDGTLAGTQVLYAHPTHDMNAVAAAGSLAYAMTGYTFVRTDGTPAGTSTFAHTSGPHLSHNAPLHLGSGDELVYRGSDHDTGDSEPWYFDGQQFGLLADVRPGPQSSQASHFRRAGNRLFFRANDGTSGTELHSLPIAHAHAWVGEPFGHGCGLGANAPRLELDAPAQLGNTVHALLSGASPAAPAAIYWSLPCSALPIGGGCSVYLAAPQLLGVQFTDAGGSHATALAIPNQAGLLGLELYLQELVVIAGGPLLGIGELSAALEIVLGP